MPLKFKVQARQHIAQGPASPDELVEIDRWADDHGLSQPQIHPFDNVKWNGTHMTGGRSLIRVQQADVTLRELIPSSARRVGVILMITRYTPIDIIVPDHVLHLLWMLNATPDQVMRAMLLMPSEISGEPVTQLDQRRYEVQYHAGLTFKHVSASFRLFFC